MALMFIYRKSSDVQNFIHKRDEKLYILANFRQYYVGRKCRFLQFPSEILAQ